MKNRNYYGFDGWGKWTEGNHSWERGDIANHFQTDIGPEPKFVYAVYSTPAYSGSATILFKRGRYWYEVEGGHCSCYGLEDQWRPQKINPNDHLKAVKNGKCYLVVADREGDHPEATQENFDKWLKKVTRNPKKKKTAYPCNECLEDHPSGSCKDY